MRLLPCPFCGGRNPGLWHQDVGTKSFPRVNCGACGSGTGFNPNWTDDDACDAWNLRAIVGPQYDDSKIAKDEREACAMVIDNMISTIRDDASYWGGPDTTHSAVLLPKLISLAAMIRNRTKLG